MNFISAQLPENEDRRAQAVERTGLIDSNQASLFNIYCELARDITGYEAILFQLFDSKDRCYLAESWSKEEKIQNLNTHRPKDGSVCAHVLLETKPLLAFDVTKHEITKTHSNEKGVKSYIGFPIIDKNNYALGMVCMMTFSKIKELSQDKIDLVEKLIKKAAHQIDLMSDQKQLTSDRLINALDIFNQETGLIDMNVLKNFIHVCNKMEIPKDFETILIDNNLCKINTKSKLELTEKGKNIQDSIGLHTKIMNNIKVEGRQANDLIEGMLDEL